MSLVGFLVVALLSITALLTILSMLGFVTAKNTFDRLHFVGPAAVMAPMLVAIAIVLEESFNARGVKSILIVVVLLVLQPALTHATARANRIRETGDWRLSAEEQKK
jgi:multisubunit Na+/H+ antiporter MnhG subunit